MWDESTTYTLGAVAEYLMVPTKEIAYICGRCGIPLLEIRERDIETIRTHLRGGLPSSPPSSVSAPATSYS